MDTVRRGTKALHRPQDLYQERINRGGTYCTMDGQPFRIRDEKYTGKRAQKREMQRASEGERSDECILLPSTQGTPHTKSLVRWFEKGVGRSKLQHSKANTNANYAGTNFRQ